MPNDIAKTAYYTLGVRAWDASQARPICGDRYAATLMDDVAQDVWKQFADARRPNVSNATRHAIIDGMLGEVVATNPSAKVVVIGAGFETRAFRLKGGRWIEVDQPEIIAIKDSRLPASGATNPLVRIPIEFWTGSLDEKLRPHAGPETTQVVLEGVLMYLTQAERARLVSTLATLFPNHVVTCDLMRKSFFEAYSRPLHEKLAGLGAHFNELSETPEQLFLQSGYRPLGSTSIALHAAKLGHLEAPPFMVRWLLGKLRDGFAVHRFERGG